VAPESRSCLGHADQGVRASPCAGAADERAVATTSQRRVRQAAWRCTCSATAAPRIRSLGPAHNVAGSGRQAHPGSACSPGTDRLPPWWAAHRFDHWPITDRSRGQRLVHPSITRHSPAPQPPGGSTKYRQATQRPWRAAAPSTRKGNRLCHAEIHLVRQPREPVNPGKNTQSETLPQCRDDASQPKRVMGTGAAWARTPARHTRLGPSPAPAQDPGRHAERGSAVLRRPPQGQAGTPHWRPVRDPGRSASGPPSARDAPAPGATRHGKPAADLMEGWLALLRTPSGAHQTSAVHDGRARPPASVDQR
jgi:hypothetical protein